MHNLITKRNSIIKTQINEREQSSQDPWFINEYEEGQLSVDVYQTVDEVVVLSTSAGASAEDVEIFIDGDLLTIRGKREHDADVSQEDYLYRECYWGRFSRSIILPVSVHEDKIEAAMNNGVLKVTLPKVKKSKQVVVKVREN